MPDTASKRSGPVGVFIVDDHPLIASALRAAIEGPNLRVVGSAETAEEAIQLAPGLRPDVVLVDIDLPDRTGIALVRELAPRMPEAKIVMLTVSSASRDVREAIRAGAAGYLTKGIRPESLVRAIEGAVAGELAMSRSMAASLVRDLLDSPRGTRTQVSGLAGLTSREQEVVHLVAAGLTDAQIADSLSISPRTVETHVSNLLRKLGVRSRAEAGRQYRGG